MKIIRQSCRVFSIYFLISKITALLIKSGAKSERNYTKRRNHFLWLQYGILILVVLILECVVVGLAFGLKGDVRIYNYHIYRANSNFYQCRAIYQLHILMYIFFNKIHFSMKLCRSRKVRRTSWRIPSLSIMRPPAIKLIR